MPFCHNRPKAKPSAASGISITHLTIRARSALAFLVLTKTHINRIFIRSLITTDYDPICLNGKNIPFFENVNMFTKLHEPINQGIRPLNLGRRKRLTSHPFLHTLTSKTVSQIFGTCVCYFFTRG